MPILLGILLSVGLIFLESIFNSLINYDIFLSLVVGILISLMINKKIGLAVIITWSVFTDLIYFPSLAVTTISLIISWLVWNNFIQSKLVANNLAARWLTSSSWLLLFYLFYWLVSWLPYLVENNPLYPDLMQIFSYLLSLLISLLIIAVLLFLSGKLSRWFKSQELL